MENFKLIVLGIFVVSAYWGFIKILKGLFMYVFCTFFLSSKERDTTESETNYLLDGILSIRGGLGYLLVAIIPAILYFVVL